ncbi:MAG: alkaline shock response membrane anchor protein AmaP [Actinomycetota bacterium]|nr:alkaline shock response membrane anchor protein AmaP [Actinomycetota bacterium]
MRIFNRIIVVLLLAALVALGIATVFYAFDLAGYRLANLPRVLGLDGFAQSLSSFVNNVENRNLNPLDYVVLGAIALLGLILLIMEFKPPTPRRVRMQQGTYITRRAVRDEVVEATERNSEVLQSDVDVAAQRRPGAKVDVTASVRRGEDTSRLQSEVRNSVQQHLGRVGVPVSNLNVRIAESDPRQTKTRVK